MQFAEFISGQRKADRVAAERIQHIANRDCFSDIEQISDQPLRAARPDVQREIAADFARDDRSIRAVAVEIEQREARAIKGKLNAERADANLQISVQPGGQLAGRVEQITHRRCSQGAPAHFPATGGVEREVESKINRRGEVPIHAGCGKSDVRLDSGDHAPINLETGDGCAAVVGRTRVEAVEDLVRVSEVPRRVILQSLRVEAEIELRRHSEMTAQLHSDEPQHGVILREFLIKTQARFISKKIDILAQQQLPDVLEVSQDGETEPAPADAADAVQELGQVAVLEWKGRGNALDAHLKILWQRGAQVSEHHD